MPDVSLEVVNPFLQTTNSTHEQACDGDSGTIAGKCTNAANCGDGTGMRMDSLENGSKGDG